MTDAHAHPTLRFEWHHKRSDIWSFGCVLYESLTGVCQYDGETISDSIGAILHKDPDWSRISNVPPSIDRSMFGVWIVFCP